MTEPVRSNRATDSIIEKAIQKHYNLVYRINNIAYERCSDRDLQIAGVDVYLTFARQDKRNCVDEKCATNYWDRPLNTFSMELSFDMCDKQSGLPIGKRYKGWFVNPNNISEYYALGYVSAESKENLIQGQLKSFECILVNKDKIRAYLKDAMKVTDLTEVEAELQARIDAGIGKLNQRGGYFYYPADGIKVVRSEQLAEKPVNIVISKQTLSSLSDIHCIITHPEKDTFVYRKVY